MKVRAKNASAPLQIHEQRWKRSSLPFLLLTLWLWTRNFASRLILSSSLTGSSRDIRGLQSTGVKLKRNKWLCATTKSGYVRALRQPNKTCEDSQWEAASTGTQGTGCMCKIKDTLLNTPSNRIFQKCEGCTTMQWRHWNIHSTHLHCSISLSTCENTINCFNL